MDRDGATISFPTVGGISLRPFSEDHFEDYLRLQLENRWFRAFPDKEIVRSAVRNTLDETTDEYFSVFRGEEYCGNISLQKSPTNGNPEIGISLLESCQNQGVGTAAIALFCQFCNEQRGITRLEVRIDPDNERSIHVFEKLGARYEGKQADYVALLERLHRELGRPMPENLAEDIGSLHYILEFPQVKPHLIEK